MKKKIKIICIAFCILFFAVLLFKNSIELYFICPSNYFGKWTYEDDKTKGLLTIYPDRSLTFHYGDKDKNSNSDWKPNLINTSYTNKGIKFVFTEPDESDYKVPLHIKYSQKDDCMIVSYKGYQEISISKDLKSVVKLKNAVLKCKRKP